MNPVAPVTKYDIPRMLDLFGEVHSSAVRWREIPECWNVHFNLRGQHRDCLGLAVPGFEHEPLDARFLCRAFEFVEDDAS